MRPIPKLKKRNKLDRVAFYGKLCSGKTWCANYLVEHDNYVRYSLAGKLKAICYDLFGVEPGNKDGRNRLILQGVGSDMRKYDTDVWIKYLLETIKERELSSSPPKIVVDDLRYKNEFDLLKRNGFTIIKVTLPEEVRQARIAKLYPNTPPEAAQHASETEQDELVPDYTITSDGVTGVLDLEEIFGRAA